VFLGAQTVNTYIGNTDLSWFDFLAAMPGVDEVNFWKPSPTNFNALSEGERFAFRLKSPRDVIGGFGVFAESSILPIGTAWEAFGPKNGVPSLETFVSSIARYRPGERVTASTFIGCRILVEPVFLPSTLWLPLPDGWSRNIVGGKRYSTERQEGALLWDRLSGVASMVAGPIEEVTTPMLSARDRPQERYGSPTLVAPRLGQGAFRVVITELYERQCALTDGKVLPALDAAHIVPYGDGGTHSKSNGILLRKDIHSVFDAGYATVDPDYRFVVSDRVRQVFNNGTEYLRLHGTRMRLPSRVQDRPDPVALRWHNEHRFEK
jgi:putative restriction endonuclease